MGARNLYVHVSYAMSIARIFVFVINFLTKVRESFDCDKARKLGIFAKYFRKFSLFVRPFYVRSLISCVNKCHSISQSIGSAPFSCRKAFVLLNGLLPKKPREADNGLGWGLFIMKCFGLSSRAAFSPAGRPHRMNTTG